MFASGRLRPRLLLLAVTLAAAACGGAPSPTPAPVVVVSAPPPVPAPPSTVSAGPAVAAEAKKPAPVAGAGPKIASLPSSPIHFEGGDGGDKDRPVKILGAHGEVDGVAAEYQYLDAAYGRGKWHPGSQALIEVDGKQLDKIDFVRDDGRGETIYFDISDYFGKF